MRKKGGKVRWDGQKEAGGEVERDAKNGREGKVGLVER